MKKDILNKINNSLFEQKRLLDDMYKGKVFLVVRRGGTIDKVYKTKRGAEGYLSKNEDWSYYDEYFMDLVYPLRGAQVVEIKQSELIGFNSWNLWTQELRKYISEPWMISNLDEYIDFVENEELKKYIIESMEYIKLNNSLRVSEKANQEIEKELKKASEKEDSEKECIKNDVKKESIKESTKETLNNDVEKVILNDDKNGVEIYFNNKPDEDVRNNLKANGFRWSKYNKCWYAKQSEDTISFANSLSNISNEELKETSAAYKEDKEKELEIKLNEMDINDIENYVIDENLSKRENNVSMFRSKDKDHNKELQNYFTSKQNEVLEVLENCNNKQIEYTLKKSLQKFKNDYYKNYIKQLEHRVANPSWAVTGRSGRNARRDEKIMGRYDKLLKESSEIIEKFNKAIDRAKDDIIKVNKEHDKKHFEENTKDLIIPKFNKVKKEYSLMATNKIFEGERMTQKTMNEYKGYYIFKNWGAYHVYDNEGNDIYNTKTTGTLEEAKKWLVYYLNNKVS